MNYLDLGGIVTSHDPTSENNKSFLAQYVELKRNHYEDLLLLLTYFTRGMEESKLPSGLYKRSPIHNSRSVSADEIGAWLRLSVMLNTNHRIQIWHDLVVNFGAYPAIIEGIMDYLPYNPSNYYAWGKLCGKNWTKIFYPIYAINLLIASLKPPQDTSNKLIYWQELALMEEPLLSWFFEKRMIAQYGDKWIEKLLRIYHSKEGEDFPLFIALNEYYNRR